VKSNQLSVRLKALPNWKSKTPSLEKRRRKKEKVAAGLLSKSRQKRGTLRGAKAFPLLPGTAK
jgi:hypothetical protein